MNTNEKGWLKEYIEFRKDLLKDVFVGQNKKSSHPEHSLYSIIQPTGLMYGQSVGELDVPDQESWSEKDRMKVLLAESLISSSLLFYDKPVNSPEEFSRVVSQTLESIGSFYNTIFPELAIPTKTFFGGKRSPIELAEKILDKRVDHTDSFKGNFWTYFFHNSLLFLDIFIYGQWIHTNADRIVADFFRYERDELRFSVVKVISAASHANRVIAFEERRLFEFFIQSTDLSLDQKNEALRIFEEGISVEDIDLPSENSWILKKFFLEMAILTIWSDKVIDQSELDFLRRFCHYLNFSDEDLDYSLVAIEGFVLEHWSQLEYLQNKKNYNEVSDMFIKRVSRIADKNKAMLMRGLQQNDVVLDLLRKARFNELSLEEKELVRKELIQLLKSIPTLSIVSMPHHFLTLPILLKILPKSLFAEGVDAGK
ncbi:MAG TPA: hypothetical protein PLJ60_01725 [Chryseolinea sp.]|nr:hypothetical protein [Chryseolinea sp.]HPM29027.1 hypothetical protein [Chryseolinea sp.]